MMTGLYVRHRFYSPARAVTSRYACGSKDGDLTSAACVPCGRFSFRSADEKGLVLSVAEAKGNIARELLSSDYTSTHDAHLTRSGGLENCGMAEDDFASLVYTLDHLRLIHPRIRQEVSRVACAAHVCVASVFLCARFRAISCQGSGGGGNGGFPVLRVQL